jgi:hypothetical protein
VFYNAEPKRPTVFLKPQRAKNDDQSSSLPVWRRSTFLQSLQPQLKRLGGDRIPRGPQSPLRRYATRLPAVISTPGRPNPSRNRASLSAVCSYRPQVEGDDSSASNVPEEDGSPVDLLELRQVPLVDYRERSKLDTPTREVPATGEGFESPQSILRVVSQVKECLLFERAFDVMKTA